MLILVIFIVCALLLSKGYAMHFFMDTTKTGTWVGVGTIIVSLLIAVFLGFIFSHMLAIFLPSTHITTTKKIKPFLEDGTYVQMGTMASDTFVEMGGKGKSKYYRFMDSDGYVQTIPMVQATFFHTEPMVQATFFHTDSTQNITTLSAVFMYQWEYLLSSPIESSQYTFALNRLEPTNNVTASF